jgi:hypothetical protein
MRFAIRFHENQLYIELGHLLFAIAGSWLLAFLSITALNRIVLCDAN